MYALISVNVDRVKFQSTAPDINPLLDSPNSAGRGIKQSVNALTFIN